MSKLEDEKLIEIVSKYELIYNLKHPKYMDSVKKELAWKEIGEHVKQPAAACKQRWQALRDAYRRALNKRKGKSGQAAKNIKLWKYESEMEFVTPFFIERKTQDSLEFTSDDEPLDNTDEDHAIHSNVFGEPNTDMELDDARSNLSSSNENDTTTTDKVRQNKPQQNELIKNIRAPKRKAAETQPGEHDELDRFFLIISDTVKKFPPYDQALAKQKIFSLVSAMELQQLAPSSSTSYSFNQLPQLTTAAAPVPTSSDNWNEQTEVCVKDESFITDGATMPP